MNYLNCRGGIIMKINKLMDIKYNDNKISKILSNITYPVRIVKIPYSAGSTYWTKAYDLYMCLSCGRTKRQPIPSYYKINLHCGCQLDSYNVMNIMEFVKIVPDYGCELKYREIEVRI